MKVENDLKIKEGSCHHGPVNSESDCSGSGHCGVEVLSLALHHGLKGSGVALATIPGLGTSICHGRVHKI